MPRQLKPNDEAIKASKNITIKPEMDDEQIVKSTSLAARLKSLQRTMEKSKGKEVAVVEKKDYAAQNIAHEPMKVDVQWMMRKITEVEQKHMVLFGELEPIFYELMERRAFMAAIYDLAGASAKVDSSGKCVITFIDRRQEEKCMSDPVISGAIKHRFGKFETKYRENRR